MKHTWHKSFWLVILCMGLIAPCALAQNRVLEVGVRLQKTVGLYYENGFTMQYSSDAMLSRRLYVGVSYVTSRLGTAISSNAIKQDNFLVFSSFYFLPKRVIRTFVRANVGYFVADLEEAIFDDLPNRSLLLSPEAGISFNPKLPIIINASLGYNLITGNGIRGPGTLYPVFIQTTITWNIFHKSIN
jgi:hypothetical protein